MEFFTTSSGITVHVWDTRKGDKTLILLHGYLETMYVFSDLIEELKSRYRIITMDLPGHGLTDSAPAGKDGISVNTIQFDVPVIEGVMQKCNVNEAILCGHSMGGFIALEALRQHPELFEKVILMNSHPYPESPEMGSVRKREIEIIRQEKLSLLASASIPKMYFEENLRRCDDKVMETVELCETHDPEGIIASIRGIESRPDLQDVLRETNVPVMLIYGDNDSFLPLDKVELMKKDFPSVNYRLISSTGHNSFIENLPEVINAITVFCADE